MKYYAMLFQGEAMGVTTSEALLDCVQEDHGTLDVAEIKKEDFEKFGDEGINPKKFGRRFTATIVESVKLTPI